MGDLVQNPAEAPARHEFVTLAGQRYACIRDVDRLAPFLMSIVSDSDAWLFVGSNSPFTAGRVDPDGAMFPYQTVDKLLRHADGSGSASAFRVRRGGSGPSLWEPWRSDSHALPVTRNLYKHVLGTNVLFEEINHELGLRFRWSLSPCAQFGLVRQAVLENIGSGPVRVEYLDGFQMLLPPGVGEESYARLSYLAGAYMRHEVLPDVPLAIYTLNAAMEDKPLPYESLRATCAWSVGHLHPEVSLSDRSLRAFRAGEKIALERELRGDFGSYLVADAVDLEPGGQHSWFTVADTALDHARLILLVKLTNFIPDGGTWLNAQRPEWNDANNALAGRGLSMVTVAHARRYLRFCERLFAGSESVELSEPLAVLVERLAAIYGSAPVTFDDTSRYEFLVAAGRAGEEHGRAVYAGELGTRRSVPMATVRELVGRALPVLERAILANRRDDGLYHGYNLLHVEAGQAHVTHLFPMLEGQAAVLGSGLLAPAEALAVLRALRSSDLYRADQNSYLLYPDMALPPFLDRNTIASVPPLDDPRIFVRDSHGQWHFQADLRNANELAVRLDSMKVDEQARKATLDLWETVFRHREFTGRSRTFFMFEGLGSIYWHMVAKLLVSVLECYQATVEPETGEVDVEAAAALADAYDHVRDGLGFRKSAVVQGAFPCDPYSHTPRDRGAQQPGMTGLVKEEVLARWGELGVQVRGGRLRFAPRLLHRAEFEAGPRRFDYVDIAGLDRSWELPAGSLAFTCCGTPVCYELADSASVLVDRATGPSELIAGDELTRAASESVFARDGSVVRLIVRVPREASASRPPKRRQRRRAAATQTGPLSMAQHRVPQRSRSSNASVVFGSPQAASPMAQSRRFSRSRALRGGLWHLHRHGHTRCLGCFRPGGVRVDVLRPSLDGHHQVRG